ncbi:hypothetical protein U8527_05325 [Kordia algicida OT-1]|uniref:Sugar-binding protein n=1 Tax=Kordia algicida OT-1 TaxID=391587 RepID=A9DMM8_9FLAO|nr:hypothetical protein [Kordia algicida]EDP97745.1 hypothetical protein KAOT1_21322 [Kordia algicida OT-1]
MKNYYIFLLSFCFAFANVHAQEFPRPELVSPEATFYTYLDNENISDPTKYNGKVKKITRTLREYEQGSQLTSTQKTMQFLNTDGELERTETRTYVYGIEDTKEVINHLENPKAEVKKVGNRTLKIIKNELNEDVGYEYDDKGDDVYVYENDLLTTFYNNNDSISYQYDAKNRLVEVKTLESLLLEEFNEENESTTMWRSSFEDRGYEKVIYRNDLPIKKIIYYKYGEVIDVYKKTFTYTPDKRLEKFETLYTRYLFDYYVDSIAINKQDYKTFPTVEMNDSIQKGIFTYSPTKKIEAYQRTKGKDREEYTIIYDKNDRMHIVEGTLTFYQKGRLVTLPVEYEYLYDDKGNPKNINSYYYLGGEKMLHKETSFEIEYY